MQRERGKIIPSGEKKLTKKTVCEHLKLPYKSYIKNRASEKHAWVGELKLFFFPVTGYE